ncbi:MAG: hypothetical protein Q7T55_02755 [Solirubrobacteraceae bacterium]|nr:hypothetical protein [Solirubrobacteraceae bacterium]
MAASSDPTAPPDRPWSALTADLIAFATAPDALDRRITLALRWVNLALAQPVIEEGSNPRPLGFAVRPDGMLQDSLLTERAIAALTELIDAGLDQLPTVLEARGELLYGWSQFDEAAKDLRAAAAACPATAEGETWRAGLEERAAAIRAAKPKPIANKDRIELVRLAKRLGDYPVRVFEPRAPKLTFLSLDEIDVPLEPRVLAIDSEARAMGLSHLAWFEDSGQTGDDGARTIAGAWSDGQGSVVLTATAAGELSTAAATTQLTDGRILETLDSPSRFEFQGGPLIDTLIVGVGGSVFELVECHLARLAAEMAAIDGLSFDALTAPAELEALNLREWRAKQAHRLEVGFTEAEARGFATPRPNVFVPLVREAAQAAIVAAATKAAADRAG